MPQGFDARQESRGVVRIWVPAFGNQTFDCAVARRGLARMVMPVSSVLDDDVLLLRALGLSPVDAHACCRRLESLGGLRTLWDAGSECLSGVLSPRARVRLEAWLELTERWFGPTRLPDRIDSPESVAAFMRDRLVRARVESFWVLTLDARNRPLGVAQIAKGTRTACLVHPREVFATAIRARAASVILIHNHPSGDPDPSDADRTLTDRLTMAGEILGIPVIDHLVVARNGVVSLGIPPPSVRCSAPLTPVGPI